MQRSIQLIGVIILAVLVIAGGYVATTNYLNSTQPTTTLSPTPNPTSSPTATPTPTPSSTITTSPSSTTSAPTATPSSSPTTTPPLTSSPTPAAPPTQTATPTPATPSPSPSPSTSPTETTLQIQVRDEVMAYIETNHAQTAAFLPVTNWTGGRITPEGLAGYETYRYVGDGWNVTIGNVVYYDITYHVNVTYTENGVVRVDWQGTVHNDVVNETSCTLNLLSKQEQARNDVMTYIQTNHPVTVAILPVNNWTGGKVTTSLLGAETYNYTGSNWTVILNYPVIPNPTYTVTANYTWQDTTLAWEGTWQNGNITETQYTPPSNTIYFTDAQIRDAIMTYIQTAPLMTDLNWTGQDITPPGLVGYSTYQYKSINWVITMGHPITPMQTYEITANYTSADVTVQWSGTFRNGEDYITSTTYYAEITQTSYNYTYTP